MAVLPMKHIHIYGLKRDRKQVLEILQRRGAVQISDDDAEDHVFQKADISVEKMQLEKQAADIRKAVEILDRYIPEQKSMLDALKGRRELPVEQYEKLRKEKDEIFTAANRLIELSGTISECNADIYRLQTQIEGLVPWDSLDLPLSFRGTKTTAAFVGTLPGEASREELRRILTDQAPEVDAVHVEIISTSEDQTCIFLLCPRSDAGPVENALRSMGFARPSFTSDIPPARQTQEWKAVKLGLEQKRRAAREEITGFSGQRVNLKYTLDVLAIRTEKVEALGHLLQSRRTFILSGYIPEREIRPAESALNRRFDDLYLEFEDPAEKEDVPVLLENNKFTEPVEGVLRSFSFPGKGEIDPTVPMAVFYYILFGLMLSDAAYGLLMVLGCGFCLRKFKNMEPGMRKTLRMFFFCGISTAFWGAMFGSWFGDAVKVVSTTFFHKTVTLPPLWFEPITDPMRMLVFSMAMGVIHLFTGLGAKLYQCIRARQYKDALYDVVFWYMLVGGLIVSMLSTEKFADILNLNFILPSAAGRTGSAMAAVAAVGIILTAGRESRNWFKRILKGLYGLYNVTGYMSDILSYSRLLALGLATGVIATVINQMGAMGGSGIGGAVLFLLVFLIGHSINIGINLLGAYVHTNRLSFVEFFGKFYEGGGSEFAPFAFHTKYFKIKEETQ